MNEQQKLPLTEQVNTQTKDNCNCYEPLKIIKIDFSFIPYQLLLVIFKLRAQEKVKTLNKTFFILSKTLFSQTTNLPRTEELLFYYNYANPYLR